MIRPTTPEETPTLLTLTAETGRFKPMEVDVLKEVLDDYHAEDHALGHRCVTFERGGQVLGFAYYAPAPLTVGTWYLYWIVVRKETQGTGVGGELLRHVEDAVRAQRGRVLFIETSSQPHYELTRRFYLKHGYEQHATLKDFYAEGDSMVVFRKLLA